MKDKSTVANSVVTTAALHRTHPSSWLNQELKNVFTTYSANAPQIVVEVDRQQARALQVPINDIFRTLQIYLVIAQLG